MDNGEIDIEFLNNCFIILESKFGQNPSFIQSIKMMLEIEDDKRPCCD